MRRILFCAIIVPVCLTLSATGCGKQEPAKPPVVAVGPSKDGDKKDPPSTDGKTPAPPLLKIPEVVPPLEEKKPAVVPVKPVAAKKERVKPTETVSLSAEAFGMEIRKSGDVAAKKFEPVFIEISGVVRTVGTLDKEPYVTLDAGQEPLGILCLLAKEKEPWAKISKGQKIKLRGQWPDIHLPPALEACELLELGTNPAIELKSDALAEEYAKNKEAVRTKYQDKPLIVTGLIVRAEKNETGAIRLILHGAGDAKVDCGFNAPDRAEAETQKIGSTVRIVGEFSAIESRDGPALRGCHVITTK